MRILLIAVAVLAHAGSARADDDIERAKKHFEVAELHFAEGEFSEAIAQYRKAHALSNEPLLLFNVGLCFEKLGKRDDAIASYRAYLAAAADGSKAGEARYRLAKLESEADKPAVTERPKATPAPPW